MRRGLRVAGFLLLHWVILKGSEPCPPEDGACLGEESKDTSALLQFPKRRRALQKVTGVVHIDSSQKPRLRLPVPDVKKAPETKTQCDALRAVLMSFPNMSEVHTLMRFLCHESHRDRLLELKDGCLYLPSDQHMTTLYDYVEHPNTWHFVDMVEDSYFPFTKGSCPTELSGVKATGAEGTQVTTCAAPGHGFVDVRGNCIVAEFLGKTPRDASNLHVFKLHGLMGLDQTWEEKVVKVGESAARGVPTSGVVALNERPEDFGGWKQQQQYKWNKKGGKGGGKGGKGKNSWGRRRPAWAPAPATAAPRTPAPTTPAPTTPAPARTALIRVRYYVCDGPGGNSVNSSVTDDMLHKQTEVLNTAYSGKDSYNGYKSYTTQQADTGFRFVEDDTPIVRLQHSGCAMDCSNHVVDMTSGFAKLEQGMIKIVLCETQLLGMASFPDYQESQRICLINPGALPGGGIRNYNLGDTGTHELGHYLGLYHTFQGGCSNWNDGISDTSSEANPNFGCPSSRVTTCDSGVDPVYNFMDYSDDRCMCTFTEDQVEDMWNDLERYEPQLLAVPVPPGFDG